MNRWRVAAPTPFPPLANTEGLLEEGADALPVRIAIVQDGATTGWDEGAMGFEEAAVWFSGRATSFRVAAGDLLPGTYACSGVEAVTDGDALRKGFPLRHPTRMVWVRVRVLVVEDRKEWEDEARLIREVKRLRALSGSLPYSSGGEGPPRDALRRAQGGEGGGSGSASQYPPLAPRPGLVRPSRVGPRTRWAIGAVGLATVLSIPLQHHWTGVLLRVVGIVVFLGMMPFSEAKDAAILRRIAAEEDAA